MSKNTLCFKSITHQKLTLIANSFALLLKKGDLVTLKGDLGSGKTSFVRVVINHFLPLESVESPTFCIMKSYTCLPFEILHLDLYRINSIEKIIELGVEDLLHHGVTFIEWPEIIEAALQINFSIQLTYIDENHRNLTITGHNIEKLLTHTI